jgi:maltose/moltooligosaccharide transporter
MGIFNVTITVPQIAAGLLGGIALQLMGGHAIHVIGLAGASMALGGISAYFVIKES